MRTLILRTSAKGVSIESGSAAIIGGAGNPVDRGTSKESVVISRFAGAMIVPPNRWMMEDCVDGSYSVDAYVEDLRRIVGGIADEGKIFDELGPLALRARKVVKVNSTCTGFAGAELRERLALGQRREDILAGLHHAILLRAMSLLARSGGIDDEFTFTGGVCKNPMATKLLAELVGEHYDESITLNIHPDSIFMGALGAALFGLDAVRAGRPAVLPGFARAAA